MFLVIFLFLPESDFLTFFLDPMSLYVGLAATLPDISRYFLCSASARARCSSYSFLLELELETKVL